MKKYFPKLVIATISIRLMAIGCLNAQTGTWTRVTNLSPNENMGTILLLTNGTIMCHNAVGGTVGTGWDLLTPNAAGNYVNGTWTTLASMHRDRFAFASQVMPDGNVWVGGGEYGAGDTAAEVYNTLTNTWTALGGIPRTGGNEDNGIWNLYDAPSELLYNGKIICGPEIGSDPSFDCLFYTPSTNEMSVAPSSPLNHDEAQWLKLPDSSVLFVGIASQNSTRYIPQTNTWVTDGNLTDVIYDTYGEESGCGLNLPNGKAIFFGATQHNAIYTPTGNHSAGTWSSAADFPMIQGSYVGQPDAPGDMMVNGHILLACSPVGTSARNEFLAPTYFVEYDYTTNTFTQVRSVIPGIGGDSLPGVVSQLTTLINLPDGNVLMSLDQDGTLSKDYWIYSPGSAPIAQGKPTINSILPDGCPNYKITGKLFNGISEGSSFGDDMQNATNYPIVRLTNGTNVYYARTSLWNRVGALQTDSLEDTAVFTLPAIPAGTYSLYVVVNGFASNPTLFTVLGVSSVSETGITCGTPAGSAAVSASGGLQPLTYSWNPGGASGASASNLTAGTYTVTVTDNNGCSVTATATITQSNGTLAVSANITSNVLCNGGTTGSASSNISGGNAPFTYSWTGGAGNNASANGLAAGTYTLAVSDSCGSSGTASVIITQPAALSITADSSNDMGSCNGSAWAIATGGTAAYSYLWTGGLTTDTITGQCSGDYCVMVTDANGCLDSVCVDIPLSTGTGNIAAGMGKITIYPNPSNGKFTLELSGSTGASLLEIYNVLGEKISNTKVVSKNTDINLSAQPSGIYFYRVLKQTGGLVGQGKIIIEK